MMVTVVMDQALCQTYLDSVFPPLKANDPAVQLKQFTGQQFLKADGTVDFRGLIKAIPKHSQINTFAVKAKGFFQSFQNIMRLSFKLKGENMLFNLVTGFNKMVEENIQDRATNKTLIPSTFKFSKQPEYDGYELPRTDEYYKPKE